MQQVVGHVKVHVRPLAVPPSPQTQFLVRSLSASPPPRWCSTHLHARHRHAHLGHERGRFRQCQKVGTSQVVARVALVGHHTHQCIERHRLRSVTMEPFGTGVHTNRKRGRAQIRSDGRYTPLGHAGPQHGLAEENRLVASSECIPLGNSGGASNPWNPKRGGMGWGAGGIHGPPSRSKKVADVSGCLTMRVGVLACLFLLATTTRGQVIFQSQVAAAPPFLRVERAVLASGPSVTYIVAHVADPVPFLSVVPCAEPSCSSVSWALEERVVASPGEEFAGLSAVMEPPEFRATPKPILSWFSCLNSACQLNIAQCDLATSVCTWKRTFTPLPTTIRTIGQTRNTAIVANAFPYNYILAHSEFDDESQDHLGLWLLCNGTQVALLCNTISSSSGPIFPNRGAASFSHPRHALINDLGFPVIFVHSEGYPTQVAINCVGSPGCGPPTQSQNTHTPLGSSQVYGGVVAAFGRSGLGLVAHIDTDGFVRATKCFDRQCGQRGEPVPTVSIFMGGVSDQMRVGLAVHPLTSMPSFAVLASSELRLFRCSTPHCTNSPSAFPLSTLSFTNASVDAHLTAAGNVVILAVRDGSLTVLRESPCSMSGGACVETASMEMLWNGSMTVDPASPSLGAFYGRTVVLGTVTLPAATPLVVVQQRPTDTFPILTAHNFSSLSSIVVVPSSQAANGTSIIALRTTASPLLALPRTTAVAPTFASSNCDVWAATPSITPDGAGSILSVLVTVRTLPDCPAASTSSSGLSPGAIAGIVVGAVAFGALVAIAVVLLVRHQRNARNVALAGKLNAAYLDSAKN